MEAIIGAASLKDYGDHAQFGTWKANQKQTRKHLRRARMGKFANGKKINQFINQLKPSFYVNTKNRRHL